MDVSSQREEVRKFFELLAVARRKAPERCRSPYDCFRTAAVAAVKRAVMALFTLGVWNALALAFADGGGKSGVLLVGAVLGLFYVFMRGREIADLGTRFATTGQLPDSSLLKMFFNPRESIQNYLSLIYDGLVLALFFLCGLAYPFYAPQGWSVGSVATCLGNFALGVALAWSNYEFKVLEKGIRACALYSDWPEV